MNIKTLLLSLFLASSCTEESFDLSQEDSQELEEQGSSWGKTWEVFNLTGTHTYYVQLTGTGQIAIEAESGKITITGGGVTWASNQTGRVTRRWLPAGVYAVKLTGTYGRAVIEPDVFGEISRRVVSDGVVWERLIDVNPATSVNVLTVAAWRAPDVEIVDYGAACLSTATRLRYAGATAGVSGTFSRREPNGTCMQHAGGIRLPSGYSYGELGGDRGILSLPSGSYAVADDVWDPAVEGPWAIAGSDLLLPYQSRPDYPAERHPRAMIGSKANGDLIFMTIDGRSPSGVGATLVEAAAWGSAFGATSLINLDGGGSAAFFLLGASLNNIVSYPSDAYQGNVSTWNWTHHGDRQIADAVGVF